MPDEYSINLQIVAQEVYRMLRDTLTIDADEPFSEPCVQYRGDYIRRGTHTLYTAVNSSGEQFIIDEAVFEDGRSFAISKIVD